MIPRANISDFYGLWIGMVLPWERAVMSWGDKNTPSLF